MPSVTHEAPIELIRQHPDLAVELLQAMTDVDLPAEIAVSLGPTDLSEVVPTIRESGASVADRKRLSTIMLNLASDAARRRLETMMTTMEWKSDFIEGFVQEGLQQGMQQGLEKGEVKAKSEDVLKVIDSRAINLTAEQREQVTSCTDIAQLDEWFDSALTAETAAAIFKS